MHKSEETTINPNHITQTTEKKETYNHPELPKNNPTNSEKHTTHDPYQKTPEELRQIVEIRHQLQESVSPNQSLKEFIPKNPTETEIYNGQQYNIEYVPKEDIHPAYGYSIGNDAIVRQDLSPRVKRFVKSHELYHCQDKSDFGGWLGREIRANIIPGLRDPLGLGATIWKTITDIDRIKFYLKRIKRGY